MKQLPPPADQCRGQRHAYVMPVTVVQRHAIRPFCLTVAPAAVPNELSMWFVPPCSRAIGRCPRNVWLRRQGLAAQTRRVMQAAVRRRVQIAVDIFCMATQYTDLASLGPLAHYTCGQVCSITHFPHRRSCSRVRTRIAIVVRTGGWGCSYRLELGTELQPRELPLCGRSRAL